MKKPTMSRAVYNRYGGPEVLSVETAPIPTPGPSEVLIRQIASSVNGGDLSIRGGHAKPMAMALTPGWPKPLGMDVVGTVAQIGERTTGLHVGDLVWGVSTASDALADYVVMKADRVALAPTNFAPVDLGALPVAGTTAIAAVDHFAKLRPAERVLVRGGAGGVGSAVVQLAHARGAHVTALASQDTEDAVRALDANVVLDYHKTRPEDLPRFDVIIDTVGTSLSRYRRRLAKGGRFITITLDFQRPVRGVLAMLASSVHGGARIRQMISVPKSDTLSELTALVEDGSVRPVIEAIYPLAEIAAAHTRAEEHGTVGKVVIAIGE